MILIDGMLYLDTGKETPMGAAASVSGKIRSFVDTTEIPTENEQSNFGFVGNSYALGDGALYVEIDNKWILFEKETP